MLCIYFTYSFVLLKNIFKFIFEPCLVNGSGKFKQWCYLLSKWLYNDFMAIKLSLTLLIDKGGPSFCIACIISCVLLYDP